MMHRRALLGSGLSLALAVPAVAQGPAAFPDRPIKITVGFAPGGSTDTVTRMMAPKLQALLGQPVVVDNRPGGSGNVATSTTVRAAPDGYNLLMGTISALAINPSLFTDLGFDPTTDLTPIGMAVDIQSVLVVPADRPWRSVADLIAAAKAKPDTLSYSSSGIGGAGHLSGALLDHLAGIRTVHVAYRGGGPAMTDLVSGKIDYSFASAPNALPMIEAGRLRALAVPTEQRLRDMPDVPTVAETLPGFSVANWYALVGPKGMPDPIVRKLSAALREVLQDDGVKATLVAHGATPTPSSPEELGQFIRTETAKWRPIVQATGAKPE
jgi:tripartite-type tricarboxylate transporter receptor subunit TctC